MVNIKAFFGLVNYTSELDAFLAEYDQSHPTLSASQRKEMAKYARIDALRDHTQEPASTKDSK